MFFFTGVTSGDALADLTSSISEVASKSLPVTAVGGTKPIPNASTVKLGAQLLSKTAKTDVAVAQSKKSTSAPAVGGAGAPTAAAAPVPAAPSVAAAAAGFAASGVRPVFRSIVLLLSHPVVRDLPPFLLFLCVCTCVFVCVRVFCV